MLIWQIMFVKLFMNCLALVASKPDIYIIALVESLTYKNCVETAFEDIKQREDILPLYNLSLSIIETEDCNVGLTNVKLFEYLYTPPTKIMVVGNGCSDVCLITGQFLPLFNLVQISYKATSPDLRNVTKYPTFFRTLHSNTGFIHTRQLLMKEFNWQRVASVIVENPLNDQLTTGFQKALQNSNNSLLFNEKFENDEEIPLVLKKLKDHRARIIFGSFIYKKEAFCEIYKQKLYGPHYVWILSTFAKNWWDDKDSKQTCTEEQFLEAAEGSFHMMYDRHTFSSDETVSKKDRNMLINNDEITGAAYDAMWAAALALNDTSNELQKQGKRLDDFTYNNSEIGKSILQSMHTLNFSGVSEQITFDEEGDIRVEYVIHRFIGGKPTIVGYSNEKSARIRWIETITWADGKMPLDQPEIRFIREWHPASLYAIVCVVIVLGILLTVSFSIFNRFLYFSRIAVTSSNLDLLFLIGCFLVLISLFVESSQDMVQLNCCIAFRFLFYIGFSLGVGSLFAKIYRIHVVSINAQMILTDQRLFIIIGVYLIINLMVLTIREGADPSSITVVNKTTVDMDAYVLITQTGICDSVKGVYFRAALCLIQGFILIFSSYLAWETRKASFPGLRDSRIIGMCVYNVLVLSIIGVGISIVVDHPTIDYSIRVACILIGVMATECIIFITKIRHYRSGKLQEDDSDNPEIIKNNVSVPPTSTSFPPNSMTLEDTVSDGIGEINKVIEERNKVIANMHIRMQQDR